MQTPKARKSSSEAPQKISPRSISLEVPKKASPRASSEGPQKLYAQGVSSEVPLKISPRAVRQIKTTGLESDSASSSNHKRTPKDRSPKVPERKSPRSPVPELQRKRSSRVTELESQISQLQEDLKKVKNQLSFSESWKKKAQQDAEESKKKLLAMSLKQEEESQQLLSQSASEESHHIELEKISQELDQAWQSEIEASQKKQFDESAALASALDEIRQLKVQLEMVVDSEATQTKHTESESAELVNLKEKLAETLLLAEDMKNQLRDCKESEVQAQAIVGETLLQLETAKRTVESIGSDNTKAMEAYDAIALELDQSRARVNLLEELVDKLKKETTTAANSISQNSAENGEREKSIEAELVCVNSEVEYLRSAQETAEIKYHEEQIRNTLQIRSAYELVEQVKSKSSQREAELEAELKKSKADIEDLKANLMDKETELQGICEENEILNMRLETILSGQREILLEKELKKTKLDAENLQASLIDKETELKTMSEENAMLKLETKKKELNTGNLNDEVVAELEAARAAEQDAVMKLGYVTEEADESNRRAAQMTEQLEAAQFANSEMEAELRRVKVQSDQWRKAAEAAASMLSTGNNGKFVERTGSLDSNYSPTTGKIGSPYVEDMDDFLKKKNGNVLKRIPLLWKKPQK